MKRLTAMSLLISASLAQGCATSIQHPAAVASAVSTPASAARAHVLPVAHVTEVPIEKDAPAATNHPLTSVVVTQCNLIVAVYMTMPDGRLLRFDHSAQLPAEQLLDMAYTASRSERVEVSCNNSGAVGYEQHDPV
jgi:hypothetical protein